MIDISEFLSDLWTPLSEYSGLDGAGELVRKDQKVPDDQLATDRIVYGAILVADTEGRQTIISSNELIAFDPDRWDGDEGFDYDIEQTNIYFPEATLSINAFNDADRELANIRRWFYTPGLGNWWLRENWDCAIRNVGDINDRTVYLETDYEKRHGFDVNLQFKDEVQVIYRTIEEIEGDLYVYNAADKKIAEEEISTKE